MTSSGDSRNQEFWLLQLLPTKRKTREKESCLRGSGWVRSHCGLDWEGMGTARFFPSFPRSHLPALHRDDWDPLAPACGSKEPNKSPAPCTLPTGFRCRGVSHGSSCLPLLLPPPVPETPPAPGSPQRGPTLNLHCKRKCLRGRSRKGIGKDGGRAPNDQSWNGGEEDNGRVRFKCEDRREDQRAKKMNQNL